MATDAPQILKNLFNSWVDDVNDPPAPSQSEATDILQAAAPDLTDQEGDDWWVAVATLYDSFSIINQPTYIQLRNHANGNAQGAKDLFASLFVGVQELTESATVLADIASGSFSARLAAIPASITSIEVNRDAETDEDRIAAYNIAIDAMRQLESQLNDILGN